MKRAFSLFQSHLDLAHFWWEQCIEHGDYVIDATVGNGHDTLFLAKLVGNTGKVIGFDIQEKALVNAKAILKNYLTQVELHQDSHENIDKIPLSAPVALIVYNLGYLPGGDKSITTQTEPTLISLKKAIQWVKPGGVISITCYSGHAEGHQEEQALLIWAKSLDQTTWSVSHTRWQNRAQAPSLLLLQRNTIC